MVREGCAWSEAAASSCGRHAAVWEKNRRICSEAPPTFEWVPAHRDLSAVLEAPDCDFVRFVAN
eukprot:6960308-Pyramimonas_sp.AAC.1